MARIKERAGREAWRRQEEKGPAGMCSSFTQQILAERLLCATIVLQTEESVTGRADLVSVLLRPPGSWEHLRSESTILMWDTYCDGAKDWGHKKWGRSGEHPEKGMRMGAPDNLQCVSENQPGSWGEQLWAEVTPPAPQRNVQVRRQANMKTAGQWRCSCTLPVRAAVASNWIVVAQSVEVLSL